MRMRERMNHNLYYTGTIPYYSRDCDSSKSHVVSESCFATDLRVGGRFLFAGSFLSSDDSFSQFSFDSLSSPLLKPVLVLASVVSFTLPESSTLLFFSLVYHYHRQENLTKR